MRKTVVINAVGLTPDLLGSDTPRLTAFAGRGRVASIGGMTPAVTCAVQATYLTGHWPSEHGIVGNGWYFRDECEVKFWRQSSALVQQPKIWDIAKSRDASFTCANICWWYAMYSSADYTVTPRPMYPADGRKLPDVWTHPADIRDRLQGDLGQFPLFRFWGPATSIDSTAWIARAARRVDELYNPTLSLVYLPHLDYVLQKRGPDHPDVRTDLRDLDRVAGELIDYFESRGASVIVLSEYGIAPVSRPIHPNRILREAGLLAIRTELGGELLDAGASHAFAVADHQVAHVYVNDPSVLSRVREIFAKTPGVAQILDAKSKQDLHLDHARSGNLILLSEPDAWFTYYYWQDNSAMPDFARTVDIHRKPGYDPVELFIDPTIKLPNLKIASTLLRKKLGFRTLLNVIPTDATLVRGSHGLPAQKKASGPLLISNRPDDLSSDVISPTSVMDTILAHLV